MNKLIDDGTMISNTIPFTKTDYEILREIAYKEHRTLRKTIQLAVKEYISRHNQNTKGDGLTIN